MKPSLFFWTIFILNLALRDTVNYGYSDTNSAPFVADLILFCFELSLSEEKQAEISEVLISTSRYFDRLLNNNSNNYVDGMV